MFFITIGHCGPTLLGREAFKIEVKISLFSIIYGQLLNYVANATPTEFPVAVLIGVLLLSKVRVLVIRGLFFIVFNCEDLVVFIESVVGGWLAFLVS